MKKFIITALLICITAMANGGEIKHLKTSDTVGDLLNHPAFKGFSRLLMPTDRESYDNNMRLGNVGSLLPYHSNVNGNDIVAAINHMIDDVNDGNTIFYDIYTDGQKKNDLNKANTGLFFFRGKPQSPQNKPGAPFAVICPGGGFSYVGSFHEGFPYAMELSKKGYNAFVLKYRVGGGGSPATQDLAAALSYIFKNAESLGISKESYSLWGSSAGARMAAYIGSSGTEAFGGDKLPKPATIVMLYTGHSDYTRNDPSTFAAIGANDGIASPSTMEHRIGNLKAAGIDVEFKKYPNLGHGFGLGTGTSAEGWIEDAMVFWEKHIK